MDQNTVSEAPWVTRDGDTLHVHVHWRDAEDLHGHLQRRGIPSINCWNAAERVAWLEVPPDTDEGRLRQAVLDWAT
jgi:hypothetical protein